MNVIALPQAEGQQAIAQMLRLRARELVPKLRERAEECERERRVPEKTIADFMEAGLLRASRPIRYQGFELGWDVLCEIAQALATGCGSQAWVQWVCVDHAHMLSTFPDAAQHDVWGADENAFISASFDPVGRARRVEGGFLFSGRHGFSSGIDYASWLICGGCITDGEKLDGPHFFLVPKSDAVVIDDWHTMGLEGTGSKSFVVTDKFIPSHRWLEGRLSHQGAGPGTAINKSFVYRLPRGGGATSSGFASLAVGMAQGVLQEWLTFTGPRKSRGVPVAKRESTQLVAAESAAEIDAAEALYLGSLRAVMHKLSSGEEITPMERATTRRNVAFACQMVLKAGTRLFNTAGGRALFRHNALQRQYRNLLAAAGHHGVTWDTAAAEYGAAVLEPHLAP
jgi:alkylation response protein AidB-like acyl-CoA dehydrogenase